jgi:hypothetical protein
MIFAIAFWIHILAGGVALGVFWLPLVTKKGGRAHRLAGWVYVGAAATIAVTAVINCIAMLLVHRLAGIFLLYVALLAAASALLGVRALRRQPRTAIDVAPPALLVVGGIALVAWGLYLRMALFVAFAVLGAAVGVGQLRRRRAWNVAHVNGMGTSCITTVTAFVVTNGQRMGLRVFDVFLWMIPVLLGAVALFAWGRVVERQRRDGRRPRP